VVRPMSEQTSERAHYLHGDDCSCGFAAGLGEACRCAPPGCICGADEQCTGRCARHDRDLHGYPCAACQEEWRAAHPRTAAAIFKHPTAFRRAKEADAAAHTEPCRWGCEVRTPPEGTTPSAREVAPDE